MKIRLIINTSIALVVSIISHFSYAANYGVNLEWDSQEKREAMQNVSSQGPSFTSMVKSGEIKEVYISDRNVDGKGRSFVNFVMDADDEAHARLKISKLPLYKQGVIKITGIAPLGSKWLDTTPTYKNYSLSFYWKDGIDTNEINRVLGTDLQRVVALNQAGLITSSYIHTQDNGEEFVKPVYLISVLAENEIHAYELSKQFESVIKGYVDVEIKYLGRKLKIN